MKKENSIIYNINNILLDNEGIIIEKPSFDTILINDSIIMLGNIVIEPNRIDSLLLYLDNNNEQLLTYNINEKIPHQIIGNSALIKIRAGEEKIKLRRDKLFLLNEEIYNLMHNNLKDYKFLCSVKTINQEVYYLYLDSNLSIYNMYVY